MEKSKIPLTLPSPLGGEGRVRVTIGTGYAKKRCTNLLQNS
jgi:hypothetical protein